MKKYLKIAYSVTLSLYILFAVLKFTYNTFYIPGISDSHDYVFLAFAAPFILIGLVSGFLQRKAKITKKVITVDPKSGEPVETVVTSEDPSLQGITYTKSDWIFSVLSVLKIPLILAAVFGSMYAIMIGIAFVIKHLTNH